MVPKGTDLVLTLSTVTGNFYVLGVLPTDFLQNCVEYVGDRAFLPHELVEIPSQHILVNSLLPLQFHLTMIPVGLDVLCVDSGHRIDKEQRMVDCSVSQPRNIPDPVVCPPYICNLYSIMLD